MQKCRKKNEKKGVAIESIDMCISKIVLILLYKTIISCDVSSLKWIKANWLHRREMCRKT